MIINVKNSQLIAGITESILHTNMNIDSFMEDTWAMNLNLMLKEAHMGLEYSDRWIHKAQGLDDRVLMDIVATIIVND